ncbi:DUF6603 domain-containing protein [Streptomyces yanii]|uniref:DUF6603 domain-containing protein n=1 Tax=Streptomyces yanii TaxID=78510 RepID=UPI003CD09033
MHETLVVPITLEPLRLRLGVAAAARISLTSRLASGSLELGPLHRQRRENSGTAQRSSRSPRRTSALSASYWLQATGRRRSLDRRPGSPAADTLFFDEDARQYAGVLHLQFGGRSTSTPSACSPRACPTGSPASRCCPRPGDRGFTPVQLGFGFTLTGIGGLLGSTRRVAVRRPARRCVAATRSTSIMFHGRTTPYPGRADHQHLAVVFLPHGTGICSGRWSIWRGARRPSDSRDRTDPRTALPACG